MPFVIRIVSSANVSLPLPKIEEGKLIASFRPTKEHPFRGEAVLTDDSGNALKFATQVAAFEFWRQTNEMMPLRPDGKPNRPLTAYNVEIVDTRML